MEEDLDIRSTEGHPLYEQLGRQQLGASIVKLTVHSLEFSAEVAAAAAELGKPLSQIDIEVLQEDGFSAARGMACHCLKWVWLQWLLACETKCFREGVQGFVEKGLKMRSKSDLFYMRPYADLYLLHCAIFGSNHSQLEEVAERAVDASGLAGHKPKNDGELYASAWSGMLKYWILGNAKKAHQQSELIWESYRHPSFSAASKPLVSPWIKGDWRGFVKAQQKDFKRLWARGRKDGTVRAEKGDEILVTVQRYPLEQKWCWAHCGLALLAHRQGIEVATDSFWFPPHALKVVGSGC